MGEVVVDHQIIVFHVVSHFAHGFTHAFFDYVIAVLAAVGQPLAQGLLGGRQDEDRLGLGHQTPNLLCALPVDLKNQIETFAQRLLKPALRGAVQIPEYFGVFEEFVVLQAFQKLLTADEVVVDAIHFSGTHRPSRM